MVTRQRTIAVLADTLAGEYQTDVRSAIERVATERDVSILFVTGQQIAALGADYMANNTIYDLVSPACCDGIIALSGTLGHRAGIQGMLEFLKSYAPLPVCSLGAELHGIPSVVVDNADGMRQGTQHLVLEHGRRRIAYITGPANNEEARERLDAVKIALLENGLLLDPRLVAGGDFTVPGGVGAMERILAENVPFDAVIGGNDNMALGAMQVLAKTGMQVPKDVVVAGFDDVTVARFASPSLTTIRQPLRRLAAFAVDSILDRLEGRPTFDLKKVPVDFVRRESCGCGYQATGTWVPPRNRDPLAKSSDAAQRRDELAAKLKACVVLPTDHLKDWPRRLLASLEHELDGEHDSFLKELDGLLEAALAEGAAVDEFQRAITLLRREFERAPLDEAQLSRAGRERLWHGARMRVGSASVRAQGKRRLEVELSAVRLAQSGEKLSTALSLPLLKRAIMAALPEMGIRDAAVSLQVEGSRELVPFVAMRDGRELLVEEESFPAHQLAPTNFFDERRSSIFVMPLTFESKPLGIMLMSAGANETLYETLRHQIGSALTTAAMHRQIVEQVAAREKIEKESAAKETQVAAEIQTALVPESFLIEGLQASAKMIPAVEAGGDYYDVVCRDGGAYITIGDVSGHGLVASLIMLMMQSMLALELRRESTTSPAQAIVELNRALYENVRHRLGRDDHATLLVLRYYRDGRLVFAGGHEELIVVRASTGQAECFPTTGVWVSTLPDIAELTQDRELRLADGDLLVLYSDGVTEARNAHHLQFGLERLCASLEASQKKAVRVIRDRVLDQVRGWASTIDDDLTLLVFRFTAPR